MKPSMEAASRNTGIKQFRLLVSIAAAAIQKSTIAIERNSMVFGSELKRILFKESEVLYWPNSVLMLYAINAFQTVYANFSNVQTHSISNVFRNSTLVMLFYVY